MGKITTVLFDFDGVITNTEPQYDVFFDDLGVRYGLGITNLASLVKGVTMPNIMEKYFADKSEEVKQQILSETRDFELNMTFEFVPGVREFIDFLKQRNFKIGLVTSSQDFKMKVALEKLELTDIFDTKVTANRITQGKPNPMCYQLAAKDLETDPDECAVFEDALFGIEAGNAAGMRVIGVSTTLPAEKLKEKVYGVISDFSDISEVRALLY